MLRYDKVSVARESVCTACARFIRLCRKQHERVFILPPVSIFAAISLPSGSTAANAEATILKLYPIPPYKARV